MTSPVVLINSFSVPEGMEEQFLENWNKTAQQMKNQPGFIETKLHRSLDGKARFKFINVALWESPEAYQAGLSNVEIFEKQLPVEANPALYSVANQY